MKFIFNNKETYLAYRSAWKTEYAALSQTIRDQKWKRKEYSRTCNIVQSKTKKCDRYLSRYYDRINELLKTNKRYQEISSKFCNNLNFLEDYQEHATKMLAELSLAKKEAQRQYLASKEKELVAA